MMTPVANVIAATACRRVRSWVVTVRWNHDRRGPDRRTPLRHHAELPGYHRHRGGDLRIPRPGGGLDRRGGLPLRPRHGLVLHATGGARRFAAVRRRRAAGAVRGGGGPARWSLDDQR